MWNIYKILDVVMGPVDDGSNIFFRDVEGNLDFGNIVAFSFLILFFIVVTVLIIRKIRKGI
jgi:hypothetical protein